MGGSQRNWLWKRWIHKDGGHSQGQIVNITSPEKPYGEFYSPLCCLCKQICWTCTRIYCQVLAFRCHGNLFGWARPAQNDDQTMYGGNMLLLMSCTVNCPMLARSMQKKLKDKPDVCLASAQDCLANWRIVSWPNDWFSKWDPRIFHRFLGELQRVSGTK